ncbi:MAG TPA: Fur family transcriptional regulator [Actinomycetota bacterium]|nr:Fur family transcriptional regulator [Actinomycetota bacterium]
MITAPSFITVRARSPFIPDLKDEMHSRGMRVTAQRMAVLEVVDQTKGHPCAEDVYAQVKKKLPHISLATVYKALGELREIGRLKVLPVSGKLRYDTEQSPDHHHLVCTRCKRVEDVFPKDSFQEPVLDEGSMMGFRITGAEVTFRGLCPRCSEQSSGSTASKVQIELEPRKGR